MTTTVLGTPNTNDIISTALERGIVSLQGPSENRNDGFAIRSARDGDRESGLTDVEDQITRDIIADSNAVLFDQPATSLLNQ